MKRALLFFGSRELASEDGIRARLQGLRRDFLIVHGGCRGADMIADRVARELGFSVKVYPAEDFGPWPACGPLRNQAMLEREDPDAAFGFLVAAVKARGSADMAARCLRRGVMLHLEYAVRP